MSTTTTNFGWTVPSDTDLVKDGAAAIRTALGGVDTSFVDLKGGTSGQILSKASGTDLDYTWIDQNTGDITGVTAGTGISGGGTSGTVTVTNSMATAIDAKGDLIAGTGADAFARLGVGSNGQVLTADSGETTGLKWATVGGGDLIRIATTTFTSSTGVNLDNVFSSTYKNYIIVLNLTSSDAGNVRARLRVSGSDNTTSNYYSSFNYSRIDGSNDGNSKFSAETWWLWGDLGGGYDGKVVHLFNPYESTYTVFGSEFFGYQYSSPGTGNVYRGGIGGTFNATTSFTGLTLYPGANTMTGEVSIYGYKRS